MEIKTFFAKISEIQPSQLYINEEKYDVIKEMIIINKFSHKMYKPILLKRLNDETIILDGHTRTLWLFENKIEYVNACWDYEEDNLDIYITCIEWCKKNHILTISDLKNRIIPKNEYEEKWIKRCESIS
jgi:hypothetical protein